MDSLLNADRPTAFCPGCTHTKIVQSLDQAFRNMGLSGNQVALVSDIGCSGLFDTFFHTHALHGLHGRALTYAAGIKLSRPDLTVIATMGDGGMGIGGAHFLAACRRNLDITLLVLNNRNFGMTGGQFSVTTPVEATVGSGFLNRLEQPMDICRVARSAGAGYAVRCSGYRKDLVEELEKAITHPGFAVVDIHGICTGRYLQKNRLTPGKIEKQLAESAAGEALPAPPGRPLRKEYGTHYREQAQKAKVPRPPLRIEPGFSLPDFQRQEIVLLGSAGQRVITAGELLCIAGMTAGLTATQKSEYNITVLTGPSITELILSPNPIDYTGIEEPSIILAIAPEGVERRKHLFKQASGSALVIHEKSVPVPPTRAGTVPIDLKKKKIKQQDWALATLAVLAGMKRGILPAMLEKAIELRFPDPIRTQAIQLVRGI